MGGSRGRGLQAEGAAAAKVWRLESFHLVGGEPRCPALPEQSDQDGKWTKPCGT